ncbi:hypothetical protein [Vibrio coralliirubri]|uniref:hypothetical protein n=1 Tax=Vibrio coralliirubri TaxID=1516159 RepID=UPI0013C5087F|nr:hypothetical protein [Vibrio coralliirubri]
MKTIVAVSNFSLDASHFGSFQELTESMSKFEEIRGYFTQEKVSYAAGSDLLTHKGFGTSIMEQLDNFAYCEDKMVLGAFVGTVFQKYLNEYDLNQSTDDLMLHAQQPIDTELNKSYLLYVPCLNVVRKGVFRTESDFSDHYEMLLSDYPIDNKSYFSRAKSHFKNIIFHEDGAYTLTRVEGDFREFSMSFTLCLKALNEFSPTNISGAEERKKQTNALTKYDCTGQGYSHKNFKFEFKKIDGSGTQELTCQYHMKPNENNTIGDETFYQNRIYFGFYPVTTKSWKVAVASIGPHINTDNEDDRYAKPKNFNN